jgi:pSer/pThr/pTyr-binding forkhead associated (FHA) protein
MTNENLENQPMPYKAFVVLEAQVFLLDKSVTSIGRNLNNDLVIRNPQVSRKHAEIRYKDGEFAIVDLDSTAGTFVNNAKVEQSKIYSGDLILIADVPLMFLDEKDPAYKDMEKQTDKIKKTGKS